MSDYITINQNAWNLKTNAHIKSEFYDNISFLQGRNMLNPIELGILGDISGKSILHLQCHFGQDSMSLAQLGANVTAVDFSEKAIQKAKEFNDELGLNVDFICSNIYELPNILDKKYDYVFTSYGVIGWLENLDLWANVISNFLKMGGKFVIVEFHPVIWMFDDQVKNITYSYFKNDPIKETSTGSYADKSAEISYQTITWNHSLSEIFTSLINHGINVLDFKEYDYSSYNCFNNMTKENEKYRIEHFGKNLPLMFSIVGEKNQNR